MTFADAKQRFSDRAAITCATGRLPSELLDVLRKECDLRPGHVIADIGSGTGFLSELFLKNGNRVYGVEPNSEMRQAGEEYLASYDGFSSIQGSAESTTLKDASVDFVTAGQPSIGLSRKKRGRSFADSAAARLGRRHLELP